jgi:hypothetical protein
MLSDGGDEFLGCEDFSHPSASSVTRSVWTRLVASSLWHSVFHAGDDY